MTVAIASIALDSIRRHVDDGGAEEVCGLLLGAPGRVERAVAARNVAADRHRRFEVDPATLLATHREARAAGTAVVGCYHSHPGGRAEPSPIDAAAAADQPGWLWLIAAGGEIGAFIVRAGGAVVGRFDRVAWAIA